MSTTPAVPELTALADNFSPAEQQEIARVAGVTIEHPSFKHFLGMAQHLGLNPLLGEIWLIETDTFDRGSGSWVTDLRPAVGRDGFFKIARRDENVIVPPRFGVVCANDTFETEDDGRSITIKHKVTMTREQRAETADNPGSPKLEAEIRGEILGSWAKLFYRDDTPPFYYYAPLSEHGKRGNVGTDGEEPKEDWLGAWSYTSALIGKCSQSYVTRLGANITGVVPADEIPGGTKSLTIAGSGGSSGARATAPDNASIVERLPIPSEMRDQLIAALAEVNRLSPFSWATAKVSIVLADADEEQVRKVMDQLDREIAKLKGEA